MAEPTTPRRHWFRFRLRTLLALPVLFAAGWWWITWPERTANQFVDLLAAGHFKTAQEIFDGPPLRDFWSAEMREQRPGRLLRLQDRNWQQIVRAQRAFTIGDSSGRVLHFEASWDRVHFDELTVTYDVKHLTAKSLPDLLNAIFGRDDIRAVNGGRKHECLITIPRDYLTSMKVTLPRIWIGLETYPSGTRKQPASAEWSHGLVARLLPVLDTPEVASEHNLANPNQ